jgi:soluble lytic murein transglycosylase-like protein
MLTLVCLTTLVQCDVGDIDLVEELPVIEIIETVQLEEIIIEETIPEMVARISREIGLNPDIALALLKEENEGYDVSAVSPENSNGSRDLGLLQLNSFYIYTDFVPRYWNSEEPFDVFDAESNTYIALSHLKYLMERFDHDILNAVRAYNGGETAVASDNLKSITVNYSHCIMQTLGYEIISCDAVSN